MENKRPENAHGNPVPDEDVMLSHFFKAAPALFCVMNAEGVSIRINGLWETVLGYTPEDMTGRHFSEFAHPDDVEPTRVFLAGLKKESGDSAFVNRYSRKDGGYRRLEWHARFAGDLIYGVAQDVTDRKPAAENGSDFFGEAFESCPSAMYVAALADRRVTAVNAAFVDMLGYSKEEAIGRTAEELNLYGGADDRRGDTPASAETNGYKNVCRRLFDKKGRIITCLCSGVVVEGGAGKSVLTVLIDITDIKASERAKKEQVERLGSLIDSMPELVFYKNNDGVYIGCNPLCAALLGKSKEDMIGKTDFDLFDPITAAYIRERDEEVRLQRKTMAFEERLSFGGENMLRETLKAPYIDASGNIIGIIGISHDITERKRHEEEIRYLSFHDQLTGLYNRRFYEEELKRINVDRNLPITVIIADINSLKFVNDAFGHREGDRLIEQVAHAIKNSCRAEDIVARTGGDEFALVLPKTDSSSAQNVLRRIMEHLATVKAGIINASVSFGAATKTTGQQNLMDVIKKAEDCMYHKKLKRRSDANGEAIDLIIGTLYGQSRWEKEHSQRVGALCERIAVAMALDSKTVQQVRLAGIMHDIGKIEIDKNILNKKDTLSAHERELLAYHPESGYRILSTEKEFAEIALYVYEHHENWDGSGYPNGLRAEEILLPARIIALAEAYDAMVNPIYKEPMSKEESISEVTRCAGTRFDAAVVKAFLETCREN